MLCCVVWSEAPWNCTVWQTSSAHSVSTFHSPGSSHGPLVSVHDASLQSQKFLYKSGFAPAVMLSSQNARRKKREKGVSSLSLSPLLAQKISIAHCPLTQILQSPLQHKIVLETFLDKQSSLPSDWSEQHLSKQPTIVPHQAYSCWKPQFHSSYNKASKEFISESRASSPQKIKNDETPQELLRKTGIVVRV